MLKLCFLLVVCLVAATVQYCVPPWKFHNGQCYVYVNLHVNGHVAQSICDGYGGRLAEPRDASTNTYLRNLVISNQVELAYLGAGDFLQMGKWQWFSDSSSVFDGFNDFAAVEPNNEGGDNCLAMQRKLDYHWIDFRCTLPGAFLCQRDPVSK